MKIEIGESLIVSWLKHVRKCQIVQTNWKVSFAWALHNKDVLERAMKNTAEYINNNYGYNLYKSNKGTHQLFSQAEIDAFGVTFDNSTNLKLCAVDVAFHEGGLGYGSKDENVFIVVKKLIRMAMCIYGYYNISNAEIIFATPKVAKIVAENINKILSDIKPLLNELGLDFDIKLICNEDFNSEILTPVINVVDKIADTSELFVRSIQMNNMFNGVSKLSVSTKKANKFSWCFENESEKYESSYISLVSSIIQDYISRTSCDYKTVQKNFWHKKTVWNQSKIIASQQEFDIEQEISFYRPYRKEPIMINGNNFYIDKNWSKQNISGFIKKAQENGYNIKHVNDM